MKPRCSGQSICFRTALYAQLASRFFFGHSSQMAIKIALPYDCDGMKQIVANASNHKARFFFEDKRVFPMKIGYRNRESTESTESTVKQQSLIRLLSINMILIFRGVRKMHRMHCHGIYVEWAAKRNNTVQNNHNKVKYEIKTSQIAQISRSIKINLDLVYKMPSHIL